MSVRDYGIFGTLSIIINVLVPLLTLNIPTYVTRKYYLLDSDGRKSLYSGAILIYIILFIPIILSSYLFSEYLSEQLNIPKGSLLYLAFIIVSQIPIAFYLIIQQFDNKIWKYAIVLTIQTVFIHLIAYLLLREAPNWLNRLLPWFFVNLCLGSYCFYFLYNLSDGLKLCRISNFIEMVKSGLFLVPHTIGGLTFGFSNRLVVNKILGNEISGIYTLGIQLGAVFLVVLSSFNTAFTPFFYKTFSSPINLQKLRNIEKLFSRMSILILIGGFLFWVILFYIVRFLFDSRYEKVVDLLLPVLLANAFNGVYLIYSNYLFFFNRIKLISIITGTMAIISVLLSIFFARQFGIVGATWTLTIVWFLYAMLIFLYCKFFLMGRLPDKVSAIL